VSGVSTSFPAAGAIGEGPLPSGTALLRFTVSSTETAVTSIIEIVRRTMETLHLDSDWISRSELALQEALLNAHLHGNHGDPGREIRVTCSLSTESAELSVQDDGCGYAFEHAVSDVNTTAPSGRGIFLIRHMMDSVTFNETGNGIVMSLFKEPDHGNQRDRS